MEANHVAIRIAPAHDLARILSTYTEWGYGAGVGPDDTSWLAEAADELIGVVRVASENDTLVLRGMQIAERWRRRGIGTRMLKAVAAWLDERKCYCVPYAHLIHFYGQVGFVEIKPEAAPAFLASRLAEYRHRSLNVVLMERPAAP